MPRLHAKHRTEISYAGPVGESVNEVHLTPLDDSHQRVESCGLTVHPASELRAHRDAFGNLVHWFQLTEPHDLLIVEAEAVVETRPGVPGAPGDLGLEALSGVGYREQHAEFLSVSSHVRWPSRVTRLMRQMRLPDGDGVHGWLEVLERGVNDAIVYESGATEVETPIEEVVANRRGVCQDMAHLMIALCRSAGVGARYVSGWLHLPGHEGPAESHAWMEAAIPGAGWRQFDPTHPRPAWEHYVRVSLGRDYADVAPLRGSYSGPATDSMRVIVEMRELEH